MLLYIKRCILETGIYKLSGVEDPEEEYQGGYENVCAPSYPLALVKEWIAGWTHLVYQIFGEYHEDEYQKVFLENAEATILME